MIFKSILGIIAYLLCGTGILAFMRWHDRHCSFFDSWLLLDDVQEQSIIVILWPLVCITILFELIIILPGLFAKGVMTVVTAIVYVVKALLKKDGENS